MEAIKLGVWRRLDNRREGLPDDSPRALELHIRRRDALHEALDNPDGWQVLDWELTDDAGPHEYVELILAISGIAAKAAPLLPAITAMGQVLVTAGLSTAVTESVKALINRLLDKQKKERIENFQAMLPNGATIFTDSMTTDLTVSITSGGVTRTLHYSATESAPQAAKQP